MHIMQAITDYIMKSILTTQGDMVVRGASIPERLAAVAVNYVLKSAGVGAEPVWGVDRAELTTQGDMVVRGATVPERLAAVAVNYVLKSAGVGVKPAWGVDRAELTTLGDLVVRGAAVPERLAAVAVGQVLQSGGVGAKPAWGADRKIKIVDIGDWNMDATASVNVLHGLTVANIREVYVMIRDDAGVNPKPLEFHDTTCNDVAGYYLINATQVVLYRIATRYFDSASHDQTSYNRGWITIRYV